MTQEQWIIYLYGIYPEGGWTVLYTVLLTVTAVALMNLLENHKRCYDNYDTEESGYHYTKSRWYKLGKWKWIIPSTLVLLLFLSNLVPNKNTFIALVATPSLIESLESETGKLNKINKLIDLGLDKAVKELNKKD